MKSTPRSLLGAVALAVLAPLMAQAAPAPAGAQNARVIVKFKAESALLRKSAAGADQAQRDQALALGARVGLPMRAGFGIGERTQVVFVSGMSSEALARRLAAEQDIEYAVPDRRKTRAAVPNDPLYATGGTPNVNTLTGGPVVGQWYLKPPNASALSSINAQSAWDVPAASAAPVVVAVLDTGIRADHPDLAGKLLLPGFDFVGPDRDLNGAVIVPNTFRTSRDGDGWDNNAADEGDFITLTEANTPGDLFYACTQPDGSGGYLEEFSSWHGTQVSGIIGAATDNGVGMASVGRERVRVLPVRVLAKCGGWDSEIIAGMKWAAGIAVPGATANTNPARVLNLSLGGSGDCSPAYQDAVSQINALGVSIVASAGNGRGLAVSEPANCVGVIGVGGVRHEGDKVGYSDVGPELSISAPAGNCVNTGTSEPCLYPILTTANAGLQAPVVGTAGAVYTDAFYATIGTSFSAPLVAGTAALMLSVNPNLSPLQVRQLLMSTARTFPVYNDIPTCHAPDGTFQDQCNCTTTTCGAGMLDSAAAVQAAVVGTSPVSSGGGGGGALGLGWLAALGAAVFALRRPRRDAPSA